MVRARSRSAPMAIAPKKTLKTSPQLNTEPGTPAGSAWGSAAAGWADGEAEPYSLLALGLKAQWYGTWVSEPDPC